MKTFDEQIQSIRAKAKRMKRNRRITAASISGCLVLALMLTLFVPFNNTPPSDRQYRDSVYYNLIHKLNEVTYQPPAYKNNYEKLIGALKAIPEEKLATGGMIDIPSRDVAPPTMAAPMAGGSFRPSGTSSPAYGMTIQPADKKPQYEEVTDNQVEGVIEADLMKRSDRYIYYLRNNQLRIYSIAQENSSQVGVLDLSTLARQAEVGEKRLEYYNQSEMFLSRDCTTLMILTRGYYEDCGRFTAVIRLDVQDPANIVCLDTTYFAGDYLSARMVEDNILLAYRYNISKELDYDRPETFVPVYGRLDSLTPVGSEQIICPEEPTNTSYTVIALIDGVTGQTLDTAALLSYSQQLYVSEDTVYASFGYTDNEKGQGNTNIQRNMTQITGISYTNDALIYRGTVELEGAVKDQYSMDQYQGILRVATSTSEVDWGSSADGNRWASAAAVKRNANLYCVDLSSWQVAASVVGFAPQGEEVTSARFDGHTAYICTAEVIQLTDPVYFFDLSDISNITWKHTPVIGGFSSSLVEFGDYLLGIGINENRELKLEAYREGAEGVEIINSFEMPCSFSEDYKSYLIDREANLVGLAVSSWSNKQVEYLLLHFDGKSFAVLQKIQLLDYDMQNVRADIIDGWLYLLEAQLHTVKVF